MGTFALPVGLHHADGPPDASAKFHVKPTAGFRVWSLGLRLKDFGLRFQSVGLRVESLGTTVEGVGEPTLPRITEPLK